MYGRNINSVLKDNLGDSWEEACATLMCEMRMYELECLRLVSHIISKDITLNTESYFFRRRMEDAAAAATLHKNAQETNSILSPVNSPKSSVKSPTNSAKLSSPKSASSLPKEEEERFTGLKIFIF